MNRKYLLIIFVVVLALVLAAGCNITKPVIEQPSEIDDPSESEQPLELVFVSSAEYAICDDCHKRVSDEQDYSLATALAKIEEHPELGSTKITDCLECHGSESDSKLVKILHTSHYNGEDNHFLVHYEGSCIHCHKPTQAGTFPVAGLEDEGVSFINLNVAQVDEAPEGCEDCHQKISDEKDYSLTASFEAVTSKIENHTQKMMTSPTDCMSCHGEGTKNATFNSIMHKIHLQGEHYENHGNSCISCHDIANRMKVKGL